MEETTPALHLYDVVIWRYRKDGGAQIPDYVGDIQAETPLKAVILLMACHRLRWIFAASVHEHGTSLIERFDATDIQVSYEYEEMY